MLPSSSFVTNYKARLVKLKLLPLIYWYQFQDLLLFVKWPKEQPDNFNISNYVTFAKSQTRFYCSNKLIINHCQTSTTSHFYFNCIVHWLVECDFQYWHISPILFHQTLYLLLPMEAFLWKFWPNAKILVPSTLFVLAHLVSDLFFSSFSY